MIELNKISRVFQVGDQQVHALDDVSLQIHNGEYISIMGPSGSGKSTLLNMLGLLDRPTSGSYTLDDQDVAGLSEEQQAAIRQRKIGFVFQFFHLIPRLSTAQNIELPLTLSGIPPAERKPRVTQLLKSMGLLDRADHRPDQLSGGQRQRVAIARAVVMNPAILLADEPTGNLDSTSGEDVLKVLEKLNRDGITLIIVTHDPAIGKRTRRNIRLVDGRVDQDAQQLPQQHN